MSSQQKTHHQKQSNNQGNQSVLEKLEQKISKNYAAVDTIQEVLNLFLQKKIPYDHSKYQKYFIRISQLSQFSEEELLKNIQFSINNIQQKDDKVQALQIFDKIFPLGYYYNIGKLYMNFTYELYEQKLVTKNKVTIVTEKVLSQFSQDFNLGSKVFKRARKIQTKIIEKEGQTDSEKSAAQNYRKQLYFREFNLPLEGLQLAYETFQEQITDQNDIQKGEISYNTNIDNLNNFLTIEEQFEIKTDKDQSAVEDLLEFFQELEQIKLDKLKIKNYFEKCIITRQESEIFQQYIKFTETNLSLAEQGLLIKRVNILFPENNEFTQKLLKNLEKQNTDLDEMVEEFERIVFQSRNDLDNQYMIFLIQIEYFSRQVQLARQNDESNYMPQQQIDYLRKSIDKAIHNFYKHSYNSAVKEDSEAFMEALYLKKAQIEALLIRDFPALQKQIEEIIKYYGTKFSNWEEMYKIILPQGDFQNIRKLLKKGCQIVAKDQKVQMWQLLTEFEKQYGTITEYEQVEAKFIQVVQEELEQQQKEEENIENNVVNENNSSIEEEEEDTKEVEGGANPQIEYQQNNKRKNEYINNETKEDSQQIEQINKKIKHNNDDKKELKQDGGLRQQSISLHTTDSELTVYVKNIPLFYQTVDVQNLIESPLLISTEVKAIRFARHNLNKGYAYIECATQQGLKDVIKILNGKQVEGKHLEAAKSAPPKKTYQQDNLTLFLNKLPYSVTEQQIIQKFPSDMVVKPRIILDENTGKCRGYAYVEFESEEMVQKGMDHFEKDPYMDSRKVQIKHSDSQTSVKKMQNLVVFIKGLSFKARDKDIKKHFDELGLETKIISVVRDKFNKPKGLAYVEFNTEQEVKKAIETQEQYIFKRQITVIKSDREITLKKSEEQIKEEKIDQIEEKSNQDFAKFFQ